MRTFTKQMRESGWLVEDLPTNDIGHVLVSRRPSDKLTSIPVVFVVDLVKPEKAKKTQDVCKMRYVTDAELKWRAQMFEDVRDVNESPVGVGMSQTLIMAVDMAKSKRFRPVGVPNLDGC